MAKSLSLGGHEVSQESGGESITILDHGITLAVLGLTAEAPVKPEIQKGLQTITDVFNHYQPELEVEFKAADGSPIVNNLSFRSISDFGKDGLIEKSEFLQDLEAERVEYQKFIKMLKIKQLSNILKDPAARTAYLNALRAMIQELEEADA